MATGTAVLDSNEQLLAITHPTRLRVLDALREPDSAAGVARRIGESRQRLNHHVKVLAEAGLLVPSGERRKGNFVEQLYESAAGTFVFSPRVAWGDSERLQALTDQLSLRHLVEFGERVQRDAVALLDRAAFDGEAVASATVEATVRFADADARAAFLDDYLRITTELIDRHAAGDGDGDGDGAGDGDGDDFTVGLVVHPTVGPHE